MREGERERENICKVDLEMRYLSNLKLEDNDKLYFSVNTFEKDGVKYSNAIIEYDGEQHFKYIPYFHKNNEENFAKQQRRDQVLNDFCELYKDKVTLIRFKYTDLNENILNTLKEYFINLNNLI